MKIFWNVPKVCMHACSSKGHPNLWSNLNSMKLLKSETPCSFDRVGLKGGQNSSKHHENWRACLSIQHASKHMIRFQFLEFGQSWEFIVQFLLGFGLKMHKKALNIVKVRMHSYFPNALLNLWLNFNSKKLVQSETPSCTFFCVPLKWVSKSTFKFDF